MLAERAGLVTQPQDPRSRAQRPIVRWPAVLPSGEQHLLSDGRQEAVVSEVGATLRRYAVDGEPVCWGFGEDEMSTGGRGQVLAPWPNRLEDGRYVHDGAVGRAALDEPERSNAIHGLVRWLPWHMTRRSPTALRCSCMLLAQPGYPFSVSLRVDYRLVDEGLVVSAEAQNLGQSRAPFGIGFHNYLHPRGNLNACQLQVPARRRLLVDERMLPRASEHVADGPLSALCGGAPQAIGTRVLDDCLTELAVDDDGRWRVRFVPEAGEEAAVTVWAEERFRFVTVYSADTLDPADRRRGLAIEPMTCPANAFRSGEALAVLEPGARFSASWGITVASLAGGSRP